MGKDGPAFETIFNFFIDVQYVVHRVEKETNVIKLWILLLILLPVTINYAVNVLS